MNEDFSFEENELTSEDLAVLKAFDAIESWPTENDTANKTGADTAGRESHEKSETEHNLDLSAEMLVIFIEEASEDIARMRQAARQIAQEKQLSEKRFKVFQRSGHKLRGTAGAVGYTIMSTAAEHIEIIAEQVLDQKITPATGLEAITQAISVLEGCQSYLVEEGREPDTPELLTALEAIHQRLGITLTATPSRTGALPARQEEISNKVTIPLDLEAIFSPAINPEANEADNLFEAGSQPIDSDPLLIHIENRRIEKLLHHTGQLIEMHATLENAQRDVKAALQEQQEAQNRLLQLEQSFSNVLQQKPATQVQNEATSSSLIARILSDAHQEKPRGRRYRNHPQTQQQPSTEENWDELDMERYSEQDLLLQALREAINQVTVCNARVNTANTALQILQQEYMARAIIVRDDAHMMRLTPLSILVPRLQKVIAESALAQQYKVEFEVLGDTIEIDQNILETISSPLLQMLQMCISDTSLIQEKQAETCRVWLHAHSRGNDIMIEIGFSMPVLGGTLEILRTPLQRVNGLINLQRNSASGVSFHLTIPRSRGTVQCLLIRSGEQQFIVPLTQVQRISLREQEALDHCYQLKDLLGLTTDTKTTTAAAEVQPILIIQSANNKTVGIQVNEILNEQDLTIKPLPAYLRRPGISESAITGQGNTLLMLDPGELIRSYLQRSPARSGQEGELTNGDDQQKKNNRAPKILVADDSAYLRQAVLQTLKQGNYEVTEARDGMEAVEQLLENTPDIFLLDIEMPNLNGYDVLNIIHEYPELAHVKTIMLTSRTSDKHIQRARELGALAYLIKPCPQKTLLNTVRGFLGENMGNSARVKA